MRTNCSPLAEVGLLHVAAQDRFVAPLPADADLTIRKDVEYAKCGDQPAVPVKASAP